MGSMAAGEMVGGVNAPSPTPAPSPAPASSDARPVLSPRTIRGMLAGQHLIAAVLLITGTIRALTSGTPYLVAIAAGAALSVCYLIGARLDVADGPRARWWLLSLILTWIGATAISAEFSWFAFLLWLLAGKLLPALWSVLVAIGVLTILVLAPLWHDGHVAWAGIIGPAIGGVFALGISRGYLRLLHDAAERERLLASLSRAQRETVDLQDELALTQRHAGQVAERTRIARDVHDTIAQAFSSIRLIAHAGIPRTGDETTARTLRQIEVLSGEGLADVRRIIAALTPAELEDRALPAALARLLERLREQTGAQTALQVDETLPDLPAATEATLLRVAQSALANVRLHAGATRVVMSLIDDGERVRLDVLDDGRGFDALAWEHGEGSASDSGYGLGFMRSRLRSLGGGLEIESRPGDGTAVSAHLPLVGEPAPGPARSAQSRGIKA